MYIRLFVQIQPIGRKDTAWNPDHIYQHASCPTVSQILVCLFMEKKLYKMYTESVKGILFSLCKTLGMLLTANARELKLHFKLKKNNILIFRCFLFVT